MSVHGIDRRPTGIITFLFTDIAGSTAMVQRLGRAFDAVLADHDRILRNAIVETAGIEIRTEGDSFFAVFSDPVACVAAMVAAQRGLRAHEWPSGGRVEVRMGAHTGEGRLGGSDYVGVDVHRAARIGAAGHGGQVLVSEATKALVVHSLPEGVSLVDLGDHRLKDLVHSERIHQVVISDLPSEFPPLRSAIGWTSLPPHPSEFVGREAEVEAVRALVAEHRLVTLTGVGGTGKTRLAIHVAASMVEEFREGVIFVALDEVAAPERVLDAVARGVGATPSGDALAAIATTIGTGSVLVILDNLEHVVSAAPQIAELVAACPGLRVLATSQVVLRVRGERVFPVPPLGLPADPSMPAVAASDSGSLFTRRVREADPSFELTGDSAAVVASIVARLDGLPLAIELAAARVRLFGLDGLSDELETSLGALGGGYADAPERHRTLRAAVEWTYQLLSLEERAVLRRCAVFVGGFTLDGARSVCGGRGVSDVASALSSLLDKSLITSTLSGRGVRFSMLEAIRVFGLDRLATEDDEDAVRRAHAVHSTQLPRTAGDSVRGPGAYEVMDRIGVERANVAAAMTWAAAHEPDLGLCSMLVMSRFHEVSSSLDEGWEISERLLASTDSSPECRLTGLLGGGSIAYWLLDYTSAEKYYDEAVDIATAIDDRDRLGEALFGLAYTYVWLGRLDEAESTADRTLGLVEDWRRMHVEAIKGACRWMRGDLAGAMRTFTKVREAGHRTGDVDLELSGDLVLGGGLIRAGYSTEGAAHVLAVLARYRELGDDGGTTESLDYLSIAISDLSPRDGVLVAAAVDGIRSTRGGTVRLASLGMADPRDLALRALAADEVERLWVDGRLMKLDEAVEVVLEWADREGVVAGLVEVGRLLALVDEAGLSQPDR